MEKFFVNPGMLWFTLAASVPIIIHLLNKQRYKKIEWAAMKFLLNAMKKTRRRLQIENILLLLVRVLILLLLVFAVARPFFQSSTLSALTTTDTHLIIVLDNSFSMDNKAGVKDTSLDAAKNICQKLIGSLKIEQGDQLSLILFDDRPSSIKGEGTIQLKYVRDYLGNLVVTKRATDVFEALKAAKEVLDKSSNSRKQVYLITDCQRNGWPERNASGFGDFKEIITDIAGKSIFNIVDVGAKDPSNLAVSAVSMKKQVAGINEEISFEVQVANNGPSPVTAVGVNFFVDGLKQGSNIVPQINGNGLNVVIFNHTFREPGSHFVSAKIDTQDLEADNERFLALDIREKVSILCVDGDPSPAGYISDSESYYFTVALQLSKDAFSRHSVFAVDQMTPVAFFGTDLRSYDVVVLANLDTLTEEKVASLEEYVNGGGSLLVFLGEKVDKLINNELLYKNGAGLMPGELGDIGGNMADLENSIFRITDYDINHSIFKPFRQRKEYLARFIYYQFLKMKVDEKRSDIRVIARYDDPDKSPAIVEKQFGLGKAMVFTSTCDDDWNILPRLEAGEYVALMNETINYLNSKPFLFKNVNVGEPLQTVVKIEDYAKNFILTAPKSSSVSLRPIEVKNFGFILLHKNTEETGIYTLEKQAADAPEPPQMESLFAVNVNPKEGVLEKISEAELKDMLPEVKFSFSEGLEREGGKQLDIKPVTSSLWKYLAYAVLALILVESFLTMTFTRKM